MREIEFRGKTEKNDEWVYGHLISQYDADACSPCTYYIIETMDFSQDVDNYKSLYDVVNYGDYYEVYENTIGQYTGKKDKNGTKIFEGDIVKGTIVSAWAKEEIICVVKYLKDGFVSVEDDRWEHSLMFAKNLVVIGNIYDNPELLVDGDDIKE